MRFLVLSVYPSVFIGCYHADVLQVTDDVAASVLGIERRFDEVCVFKMLASDNRTLEEALAAYNESLQDGTNDQPISASDEMFSSDILTILAAMSSQVCPGQPSCSGRGTCANSTCTCSAGKLTFTGIIIIITSAATTITIKPF